jgi:predicted ArsR family transcriptional regulator
MSNSADFRKYLLDKLLCQVHNSCEIGIELARRELGMTLEQREQGATRQQILELLRRKGQMTASELSDELGIGAVGVRQHLALLERDNLVQSLGVRRGIGRPSHLYALTHSAEELFPRRYDKLATDAIQFIEQTAGAPAVDQFFASRREKLRTQFEPRLVGKPMAAMVEELATILTEQGYMCEWEQMPDGSFQLIEHNCPVDCVARDYPQACSHELQLYQDILGIPITREETIAAGANCCRYRIGGA